jgi:predicted enzyme related to lactoylglutathione lyase
MKAQTKSLVAFVHVTNVQRSIKFYADLGFVVTNSIVPDGKTDPSWAYLQSKQANLMLGLASAPIDSTQQAILFYLYFDDIKQTHNIMAELGHKPGAINYPFYMADGEFRLEDPDGYVLMLAQS